MRVNNVILLSRFATIRRILQSSDSLALEQILNGWIRELRLEQSDDAIAVDGKVLRGANDTMGQKTHLRSRVLHEQGTTIAQLKINNKSNEILIVSHIVRAFRYKRSSGYS